MDKYEDIFNKNVEILAATELKENSLSENDAIGLLNRDNLYTALLTAYVAEFEIRHRNNRRYKLFFFIIVMSIFCIAILGAIAAIVVLAVSGGAGTGGLVVAVTSFGTILSSLIIIPKIIAQYLFPLDEDQKVAEIVGTLQQNDANIRQLQHKGDSDE